MREESCITAAKVNKGHIQVRRGRVYTQPYQIHPKHQRQKYKSRSNHCIKHNPGPMQTRLAARWLSLPTFDHSYTSDVVSYSVPL